MERIQRDTGSRFHRLLLSWISKKVNTTKDRERAILERWGRWSGAASDDPRTFTEALRVHDKLLDLLLGRVRRRYLPPEDAALPYQHRMARAWQIAVLEQDALDLFGFEPAELAGALLAAAAALEESAPLYPVTNRWQAQHPFVDGVAWIGGLFRVNEPAQVGYRALVRTEMPRFGASARLVYDLGEPWESTWSLPVGQSGHAGTTHYGDLQDDWAADRPFAVFGDDDLRRRFFE